MSHPCQISGEMAATHTAYLHTQFPYAISHLFSIPIHPLQEMDLFKKNHSVPEVTEGAQSSSLCKALPESCIFIKPPQ